jgi:hypothetical protein
MLVITVDISRLGEIDATRVTLCDISISRSRSRVARGPPRVRRVAEQLIGAA